MSLFFYSSLVFQTNSSQGHFFSKSKTNFSSANPRRLHQIPLASAKLNDGVDSPSSSTSTAEPVTDDLPVMVGEDSVPLKGVIQFEKSKSSFPLEKWGRIALLSGGDVLALVLFSAVGRFSHGFSVFDIETLKTAAPFIAGLLLGWFLGAYFLGGYDEDDRGMNDWIEYKSNHPWSPSTTQLQFSDFG